MTICLRLDQPGGDQPIEHRARPDFRTDILDQLRKAGAIGPLLHGQRQWLALRIGIACVGGPARDHPGRRAVVAQRQRRRAVSFGRRGLASPRFAGPGFASPGFTGGHLVPPAQPAGYLTPMDPGCHVQRRYRHPPPAALGLKVGCLEHGIAQTGLELAMRQPQPQPTSCQLLHQAPRGLQISVLRIGSRHWSWSLFLVRALAVIGALFRSFCPCPPDDVATFCAKSSHFLLTCAFCSLMCCCVSTTHTHSTTGNE